ncbi:MAG: bifunctional DNA primase/polymerase [Candidatus Schekmanbacteria bacterium]|nr:bifunctional DNA primase/polymerase [Candidatus Schekmanbacteria bacterium]
MEAVRPRSIGAAAAAKSSAPVQAALQDYAHGVYSIPIPAGRKGPRQKQWQHLRHPPDELAHAFSPRANRGRLLGIAPPEGMVGGFVVCVDLDTPLALALAARWLPETGEIGGRAAAPTSHWFYESCPPPDTTRYTDPDGTRLLEALSTGTQVLVPPSIHPSGESYTWASYGHRHRVDAGALLSCCSRLAAATLLARRWPEKGCRQQAALAVAGALLESQWSPPQVEHLLLGVTTAAGDEETSKRVQTVAATQKRRRAGGTVCAWPTLVRIFGEAAVDRLRAWLHLQPAPRRAPTPTPDRNKGTPALSRHHPPALGAAAYHGLAGDIVGTLAPHTEADPAALLFQFLTAFGNAVGPFPHVAVEATRHGTTLFCVLVGASSKARKGTSWQHILRLLRLAGTAAGGADHPASLARWLDENIKDGLSSGEGLIWHVRDPQRQWQADRKGGGREIIVDRGIDDKRLLIQASELIAAIRCMARTGNTLSAVLRCAWDSGDLRILTRNQPVTASGAHISIVGHITTEELRRGLGDIEVANGFANRFLWVFVRRSKLLPDGGALGDEALMPLAEALRQALGQAAIRGLVPRDEAAAELWRTVYGELSAAWPGIAGSITGRAEAQVVRLSLIYALLDGSATIGQCHLEAALECWRYASDSVAFIFGDATGDPIADTILQALKAAPDGLTRTQMHDLFGRHRDREAIDRALAALHETGSVNVQQLPTEGRPRQVWSATHTAAAAQDLSSPT